MEVKAISFVSKAVREICMQMQQTEITFRSHKIHKLTSFVIKVSYKYKHFFSVCLELYSLRFYHFFIERKFNKVSKEKGCKRRLHFEIRKFL